MGDMSTCVPNMKFLRLTLCTDASADANTNANANTNAGQ